MRLDIYWGNHCAHVSWFDEDGEGAWVGQDAHTPLAKLMARKDEARRSRTEEGQSDFEYVSVEIAAKQWAAEHKVNPTSYGFEFDSGTAVKRFLVAMRAAAKVARVEYGADEPWPEWAKQAKAAGWKPPKGWKP